MLEDKEIFEKCESCFSQMAYLLGYCPVCNDTGLVKKQAKKPLLLKDKDYVATAGNYLIQEMQ